MGIFANALESRSTIPAEQISRGFFDLLGFGSPASTATPQSALTLSAFYNGVEQISNDIAKLPKSIFKKEGENRFRFPDHAVDYLIASSPNNLMTAFDFWKVCVISVIMKGNAFAEIVRNNITGTISEFVYLDASDVQVFRYGNKLFYKYKGRDISGDDMLHIKGFSFDGLIGVGVVTFAAKQLGVSLEAQNYGSEIFKDRGMGYGVLETDQPVENGNKKIIEDGFTAKMTAKSKFKVPVLDAGFKYKTITLNPAEAQFLETNKNGVLEVCRWLNIAPHKLKDLTQGNFSNVYQQSTEHVQDSILPWVIRIEQELDRKCFSEQERGRLYIKMNIAVLLRGDLVAQAQFFTSLIYAGVYTRNEVRALLEMNAIEGAGELLQPVNMQALSMANEILKQQSNDNGAKA